MESTALQVNRSDTSVEGHQGYVAQGVAASLSLRPTSGSKTQYFYAVFKSKAHSEDPYNLTVPQAEMHSKLETKKPLFLSSSMFIFVGKFLV